MKQVTLFTDGACSGNPGPGGYGAILVYGTHRRELSGGFADTTNNRMELRAVIEGLKQLKEPCRVHLVSDSQYVINALEKRWAHSWRKRGWRRSNKEKALNSDLWEVLLTLTEHHRMTYEWVRGHQGHNENERCDQLAVAAAAAPCLVPDRQTHP